MVATTIRNTAVILYFVGRVKTENATLKSFRVRTSAKKKKEYAGWIILCAENNPRRCANSTGLANGAKEDVLCRNSWGI